MITLRYAAFELELAPACGGSVAAFRMDGRDVLRPAPGVRGSAEADPLEMAAFPLLPFPGRIAFGRFTFDGELIRLPANFPLEPHAIHGDGWKSRWLVQEGSTRHVTLRYEHREDDWPWSYRAEQRFELDTDGLSLQLSLANRSARAMPAALGWHPYFPRTGARLIGRLGRRWAFDPAALMPAPDDSSPPVDWREAQPAEALRLDDVFEVGSPDIQVLGAAHRATLEADALFGFRVIYAPPGESFFCVEPITQVPNALNSALPRALTGLRVLEPGATLSGLIRLLVAPCDRAAG